jgi:hypothetical protein
MVCFLGTSMKYRLLPNGARPQFPLHSLFRRDEVAAEIRQHNVHCPSSFRAISICFNVLTRCADCLDGTSTSINQ